MPNPLANPAQFGAELAAAAMREMETVRRGRAAVAGMFQLAWGKDTPADASAGFEAAMDEYIENYLYKAAACDPVRPGFVRAFMPPYRWNDRDVAGTRMAGDNPDTCYRMAGIAHGGCYRVTVTPVGDEPVHASFTLNGNFGASVIIQNLEIEELARNADGGFTLTIDDRPADGRCNHLTTTQHTKFLFVRERFEDWSTQTSYDLQIERLDQAPSLERSIADLAAIAAFRAAEDVPLNFWMQRLCTALPEGTMRAPASSGGLGGLATMASALAWYQLEPDDAVLVRYHPADAAYASTQLTDWWFRSIDADQIGSSLSRAQSVVDDDGWISLVIARNDPGIANWLDTGGLSTVLFMCRWQGLPGGSVTVKANAGPRISAEKIKRSALPEALLRRQALDPVERTRRNTERLTAWNRRTEDRPGDNGI